MIDRLRKSSKTSLEVILTLGFLQTICQSFGFLTNLSFWQAFTISLPSISSITTIGNAAQWNISLPITLTTQAQLNCGSVLSGSSSNNALVSNAGITFSGILPSCTAALTVTGGGAGATTIILNASYGPNSSTWFVCFYLRAVVSSDAITFLKKFRIV